MRRAKLFDEGQVRRDVPELPSEEEGKDREAALAAPTCQRPFLTPLQRSAVQRQLLSPSIQNRSSDFPPTVLDEHDAETELVAIVGQGPCRWAGDPAVKHRHAYRGRCEGCATRINAGWVRHALNQPFGLESLELAVHVSDAHPETSPVAYLLHHGITVLHSTLPQRSQNDVPQHAFPPVPRDVVAGDASGRRPGPKQQGD